jgi:negative regulator of sigma E activity
MTCAEIREQFSGRLDLALSEEEHELLAEHLATCPECRREWGRFAATVSLLRSVEPVRAPAGFVDRVLAASRPEPWYRRLTRGLLVPWPVKLPLEAAALVMVAGLAVLIFQHSSELRQMAYVPEPTTAHAPPTTAYAPEPATASAPEPKTAPASPPATAPPPDSRALSLAKQKGESATGSKDAPAEVKAPPDKHERAAQSAEPPQGPAATAPAIAGITPAPSSAERRGSRADNAAKEAERDDAQVRRLAVRVPPNLEMRLAVGDRAVAEREVGAIVERLGGALVAGPAPAMLEIMVPRDTLGALTGELARLGTLRIVGQPADLPDSVRINLQLTD